MRNRNTIYFTPEVFDELLAENQMDELKKRLLYLFKTSSSMDGLYALKKYVFAFPKEEIVQCPSFLLMAAILSSMDGNRLQAEHFLNLLRSCEPFFFLCPHLYAGYRYEIFSTGCPQNKTAGKT